MTNNTDYLAWKAAAHAIKACEADAITFQETNLMWNKIHCKRVHQILQASIGHATIATSNASPERRNPPGYDWQLDFSHSTTWKQQ